MPTAAGCASSSWRNLTAPKGVPRVGVLSPAASEHLDPVREAGGEPLPLGLPGARPKGGVALHREWITDWTQISCSGENLDALLVSATEPAELAALLIAALRLYVPVVVAVPLASPYAVALAALGFVPLNEDPAEVVVGVARAGGPRSRELIEGFSLANALRAGLTSGAGPELLVHLAAIAREAGVVGFPQMIRVLAPESPEVVGSFPLETHRVAGLFAYLGDVLHDTRTVTGRLSKNLPPAPPTPEAAGSRLVFVRGRASGTEIVCRANEGLTDISGDCRLCSSEEAAVRAVESGTVDLSDLLVVVGCGPRGGPGLLRLDRSGRALREADLNVPVLTDGLPPENTVGVWASLATPEATAGGGKGGPRGGEALRAGRP